MPYTDLLRVTVLLTGAEATALAAITAVAVNRDADTRTLTVAAAWWLIALIVGFYLGRPSRAAESLRDTLAQARTATSLPPESPARIAAARLWPVAVTAVAAGYALLVSLAWHSREPAVLAIEQRDGVKFYVVPNSALRPIQLVRTPGLRSSRRAHA